MKEITVGSKWIYEVHRGDLIRVEGVDSRTVHILWVNTGSRKAWPVDSFLTHFVEYDKPDVLPVEGASIAEALQYLGYVEGVLPVKPKPGSAMHEWLTTIRSALERAAVEGEAHAKLVDALQWLPPCELSFTDEEMFLEEVEAMGWRYEPLPAPPKGSTP